MTSYGGKAQKWQWREDSGGEIYYGCKHDDKWNSKYFNASEWAQTSASNSSQIIQVTISTPSTLTGDIYPYAQALGQQTATATNNWYESIGGMNWYYNYMTGASMGSKLQYASIPPETPEQRAERNKRYEERLAKELAARKAAECRAELLLFSILTPAQVKQYSDDGFFEHAVDERIYRIKKGVSRNIEVIEAGKVKALLCAHPSDAHNIPIPDVMLSQLLAIRADEAGFLKVANRTVLV